jgi:hypothetical protein
MALDRGARSPCRVSISSMLLEIEKVFGERVTNDFKTAVWNLFDHDL